MRKLIEKYGSPSSSSSDPSASTSPSTNDQGGDSNNIAAGASLRNRKLTFKSSKPAPQQTGTLVGASSERHRQLAKDLERFHAGNRYVRLSDPGKYVGDTSTQSEAVVRHAVQEDGRTRTLRSSPSFTALSTSSKPHGKDLPDALKTSVESVLREVVYAGERRFRGTDSGTVEYRTGPKDLQWKPCDNPTGLSCDRPTLGANGRAYVVRGKKEVVDLSASKQPSLGSAVSKSPWPIVSLAVDADSHGFMVVNTATRPHPPSYAVVSAPVSPLGTLTRKMHPVVLGSGEKPASTPQRPYTMLAVAGDRLLLVGEQGGLYSIPVADVKSGGSGALSATPQPPLIPQGRTLGFAHVHDGAGGTALHALCIGPDGRLSSLCWNPTTKQFDPGEDFGPDALLYGLQHGSRKIEVPHHQTVSLDGKGTDIGIIAQPHPKDPGLKRHQLLFRDVGGAWKPFESKYQFHQLGVDPTNTGATYALVRDGRQPKRIATLVPAGDRHVPVGVSYHRGIAEAGTVKVIELDTSHVPERFAAGADGTVYYATAGNKLYRHVPGAGDDGSSSLLTVPGQPSNGDHADEAIPLPHDAGPVRGMAVDNQQRLHVLAGKHIYRHDEGQSPAWVCIDPGLPPGAKIEGLTHNRLGDLIVHADPLDGSGMAMYRVDQHGSGNQHSAVTLRPPSPATVNQDSVASDTMIEAFTKKMVKMPSTVTSALGAKLKTMQKETFPAARKLWESYLHSSKGHPGLQEVYGAVMHANEDLARLAREPGDEAGRMTLGQFLATLDGLTGIEANRFTHRVVQDLQQTLDQLRQLLAKRPGPKSTDGGRELFADLASVAKNRLGTAPGDPGAGVLKELAELAKAGVEVPYTGLTHDEKRTADNRCGLLASRAAMLTSTLVSVAGLSDMAEADRAAALGKLVGDYDASLVKRATDLGFSSMQQLENAYSVRTQLLDVLSDPTSPQFGHVADMLDASHLALNGPGREPTMRERIETLKSLDGDAATALRQELNDALRRGLVRHLLHNMSGDITTLTVEGGAGIDALGALLKGGGLSIDVSAVANFDFAAIFRSHDDGLSLELTRTKSLDGNLSGELSGSLLAKLGAELRGGAQHATSGGAQVRFARHAVAPLIADFLDPQKHLFDILSHGTASHQLTGSHTTISGGAQAFAKAGTVISELLTDDASLEFDAAVRPFKVELDASGHVGWGEQNTAALSTSGQSSTSWSGRLFGLSGGSAPLNESFTAWSDPDQETGTSLSGGFNIEPGLPSATKSIGGESTATFQVDDWTIPARASRKEVMAKLDEAVDLFPDNKATLDNTRGRMETAIKSTGPLAADVMEDLAAHARTWNTTDRASQQRFVEALELLAMRHRLAVANVPSFGVAQMDLHGSSLEQLQKQAPDLMAPVLQAAEQSLELATWLERARAMPDTELHVTAQLKPSVHLQAQNLLRAGLTRDDPGFDYLLRNPANYRISRLTVMGSTDYTSHANFAPVVVTLGGGSSARASVVKGSIGFTHDANGLSGFSASRSLRDAHDTQEQIDRRMELLHGLEPVLAVGVPRQAIPGQTRHERASTTASSRQGSNQGSSSSLPLPPLNGNKSRKGKGIAAAPPPPPPTRRKATPPPEPLGTLVEGQQYTYTYKIGAASSSKGPVQTGTSYDPYADPESLYYQPPLPQAQVPDGTNATLAATIIEQQAENAQAQQPAPPPQRTQRSVRSVAHKLNKVTRKLVGAKAPKSRREPPGTA